MHGTRTSSYRSGRNCHTVPLLADFGTLISFLRRVQYRPTPVRQVSSVDRCSNRRQGKYRIMSLYKHKHNGRLLKKRWIHMLDPSTLTISIYSTLTNIAIDLWTQAAPPPVYYELKFLKVTQYHS